MLGKTQAVSVKNAELSFSRKQAMRNFALILAKAGTTEAHVIAMSAWRILMTGIMKRHFNKLQLTKDWGLYHKIERLPAV